MRAIVTFHSVGRVNSPLAYPPDDVAHLLDSLIAQGFPIYDLDTLLLPTTSRGIAITFDDGMQSVFSNALPLIREREIPAHLFLTTGAVGASPSWTREPEALLNWHQIEALHAAGVRVESHTANHPDLRTLNDDQINVECEAADRIIEERLGERPRYFAYPYGLSDKRVQAITGQRYQGCVTTELRVLRRVENPVCLPRLDSYYLRSPWVYRHLLSQRSRTYLGVRRWLRVLRGST